MKTQGRERLEAERLTRSVLERSGPPPLSLLDSGVRRNKPWQPRPEQGRAFLFLCFLRGLLCRWSLAQSAKSLAQSKTWRLYFCLLFSTVCFGAVAQYAINWHTIDGGGGTSTNGQYSLAGTIGQADASMTTMTNGPYSLTGGFWVLPSVVQMPGAPTLTIVPAGSGEATISWSPAIGTNWVLQENLNLATTNWVNSPSGWTNPVVVPAALPQKFYRLHQP